MYKTPLFVAVAAVSGVALVALAAAFLPDPRPADAGHASTITIDIDPSIPTELDAVSITVAGDVGEQFCGISSQSILELDEDKIVIFLSEAAPVCSLILRPTTFSVTEEIGLLPPGVYDVAVISFNFDGLNDYATFTVAGVAEVGGIAELPQMDRALLEADSSDVSAGLVAGVAIAIAAGALALGGAAWYAKRRLAN